MGRPLELITRGNKTDVALGTRGPLTGVLGGFAERDYLTVEEAERIGRGVIPENTRRFHGIAG